MRLILFFIPFVLGLASFIGSETAQAHEPLMGGYFSQSDCQSVGGSVCNNYGWDYTNDYCSGGNGYAAQHELNGSCFWGPDWGYDAYWYEWCVHREDRFNLGCTSGAPDPPCPGNPGYYRTEASCSGNNIDYWCEQWTCVDPAGPVDCGYVGGKCAIQNCSVSCFGDDRVNFCVDTGSGPDSASCSGNSFCGGEFGEGWDGAHCHGDSLYSDSGSTCSGGNCRDPSDNLLENCNNQDGWACRDSSTRAYKDYSCESNPGASNDGCGFEWTNPENCPGGCSGGNCIAVPAPSVNLSSSPGTIDSGQSTTLSWTVSNATSCSASVTSNPGGITQSPAWTGSKNAGGGSQSTTLTGGGTIRFNLACSGAGGTGSDWEDVTVNAVVVCTDECSPSGSTRCLDSGTRQTCGDYVNDCGSDLEWGNNTSCGSDDCSSSQACRWVDYACSAGSCGSTTSINISCDSLCPVNQSCDASGNCVAGCTDSAPSAASGPSPSSGATNVSTAANLSWTWNAWGRSCAGQNDRYTLYFEAGDSTPDIPVVNNQPSGSAFYDPGAMSANITYYWQIQKCNGFSCISSSVWSFTTASGCVNSAPSTPSLSLPSNGATGVSINPTVSWNAISDWGTDCTPPQTNTYTVYLDTSVNPTTNRGSVGQAVTSLGISGLNTSTTYYWKVRSNNGALIADSAVRSFTTASACVPSAPNGPTLSSPSNGAAGISTSPTVSWNAISDWGTDCTPPQNNTYTVYLDTSATPTTQRGSPVGEGTTSLNISGLNSGTTYYWRVRASNGDTSTYSAQIWSFTTAVACVSTAPAAPTLSSPSNGAAGISTSPTVSWNAISSWGTNCAGNTNTYTVFLDTSSNPTTQRGSPVGEGTTNVGISGLNNSTGYYWKVRASNGALSSDSSPWPFSTEAANTQPQAINLSVNEGNYCTAPLRPIFSWIFFDPDPGATQSAYRVQADNNSDFSSPEVDSGKVSLASNAFAPISGIAYGNTYSWRVMVWDDLDLASNWFNGPPFTTPAHAYPDPRFTWSPASPLALQIVQFTDTSICVGACQVWEWNFDNGKTSTIQNATTTYSQEGTYEVSLGVTDSSGYACKGANAVTNNVTIGPAQPKWIEVPPFSWIIKAFAALGELLNGVI